MTSDEPLAERLARLARERDAADVEYNEALTRLDAAGPPAAALPAPPASYDASQLAIANALWNLLPDGPPAFDGSIKGRMRRFVWRLLGPPLEQQTRFNAALIDHLNRNVASHEGAHEALAAAVAALARHGDHLARLHTLLVRYLQTITLYVDTKDRSVAGGHLVLNAGLSALSDDWMKRWASLDAREARFRAAVEATDDLRAGVALAHQTALTVKREVERWIAGAEAPAGAAAPRSAPADPPSAAALDAYKYLGFEDAFRGSRADIRVRLSTYVTHFEDQTDVLDLGCGRGEFLELLRDHGIRARGLDLNPEMVETSRAKGLDVTKGDALAYLGGLPDASLGGLFAAQVIEHLPPPYLQRLLEVASHKVRPGGIVVLETINPACWLAFFESFIRDWTHVWPIHPESLQFYLRASGFHDVRIEFRSPVPEADRLQPIPARLDVDPARARLIEAFNENVAKLNARLFTHQDFAAVARK
jgi:SAM-dependent methyltransferase